MIRCPYCLGQPVKTPKVPSYKCRCGRLGAWENVVEGASHFTWRMLGPGSRSMVMYEDGTLKIEEPAYMRGGHLPWMTRDPTVPKDRVRFVSEFLDGALAEAVLKT